MSDGGTRLGYRPTFLVFVVRVAMCRRLIKGGGVYLNNERVESDASRVETSHLIDDKLLLVRIGQRNNFIVQVQ